MISHGILILNYHLEDLYELLYYALAIDSGNTLYACLFGILILNSLLEYFYSIGFLNHCVCVPIPHMVYSSQIFYYEHLFINFYIYNYYIYFI